MDGINYIKIVDGAGNTYHGGNQSWWKEKAGYQESKGRLDHIKKLGEDKYYRLWKTGCGVIAMCDAELYLRILNTYKGDHIEGKGCADDNELEDAIKYENNKKWVWELLSPMEGNVGVYTQEKYMTYVEALYSSNYKIGSDFISCIFEGLKPWCMKRGLNRFLSNEAYDVKKVTWARYWAHTRKQQKKLVLLDMKRMLNANIPVVFSYYAFGKKKQNQITLYLDEASAKNKLKNNCGTVNGHYMTIIGLLKYGREEDANPKYILKVVSWGRVYYIDYDEYADKLSYFSNILSIY